METPARDHSTSPRTQQLLSTLLQALITLRRNLLEALLTAEEGDWVVHPDHSFPDDAENKEAKDKH